MKATAEVSLYPLHEEYEKPIIDFIKNLKKTKGIDVETNGLSTQLFGDYDIIMDLMKNEMKKTLENNRAVFVIKIAQGELRKEDLPESLK